MKPFSESCEENKHPILAVLQRGLATAQRVLEIGSGTGQHAVFFAQHLSHLQWYATDVPANLPGIQLWIEEAKLPNLHGPQALDVRQSHWPLAEPVDTIFSANTAHIMDWPAVQAMFAGVGRVLPEAGRFYLYGPFNYHGRFTSESNARFDAWLKARDPNSGVRDIDELSALAQQCDLELLEDHTMPVNNRTLVWYKRGGR